MLAAAAATLDSPRPGTGQKELSQSETWDVNRVKAGAGAVGPEAAAAAAAAKAYGGGAGLTPYMACRLVGGSLP